MNGVSRGNKNYPTREIQCFHDPYLITDGGVGGYRFRVVEQGCAPMYDYVTARSIESGLAKLKKLGKIVPSKSVGLRMVRPWRELELTGAAEARLERRRRENRGNKFYLVPPQRRAAIAA